VGSTVRLEAVRPQVRRLRCLFNWFGCDVGQPILAAAAFQGGFACDHRNGSCLAMLRLRSQQRPPERRLQPGLAAPHSGKPQTVSISRIPRRRITLSVSEGTVWPEPRPLADAQGYSEYALWNRRGAQWRQWIVVHSASRKRYSIGRISVAARDEDNEVLGSRLETWFTSTPA